MILRRLSNGKKGRGKRESEREGGEETGGWDGGGRERPKGHLIVCIHACILHNIMCIYIICTHVPS